MKTTITLLLALIIISFSLNSQDKIPRFGKIDKNILKETSNSTYPESDAYYIFNSGLSYFEVDKLYFKDNTKRDGLFTIICKKHFRIKILNKEAFDLADIIIPFYEENQIKEKVYSIKATTYNMVDGKVVKTKLHKEHIYTGKPVENWNHVKFTLPNVKVGSIIEVSYILSSKYFSHTLNWQFQYNIPVLLSKYDVQIPEYFEFSNSETGSVHLEKEFSNRSQEIDLANLKSNRGKWQVNNSNLSTGRSSFEYREDTYSYLAKNIPAMIEEEYLTTIDNYISKVKFELLSIQYPGSVIKSYSTNWASVSRSLNEDSRVGVTVREAGYINDDAEFLKRKYNAEIDLINGAFSFIKNKLSWNGYHSKYSNAFHRKAYINGIGNSADVNLSLVSMFRKLGFESFPVVLSTRENGFINEKHPTIDIFNYVIALVIYNDEMILFDATEKNAPPNFLPVRCLNGKGLVVMQDMVKWVDLNRYATNKKQIDYNLKMTSENNFTGEINYTLYDFSAFDFRNKISKYTTQLEYLEDFQNTKDGLTISEFLIDGLSDLSVPVTKNIKIEIKGQSETGNDIVLFSPLFYDAISESPFKPDERSYPVEFPYTELSSITITIEIPEGLTVESLPAPAIISFPDKSVKYIFSASQIGNKIQIISNLNIKRTEFSSIEYPGLKELFDLMVSKCSENIILKKTQ